METYYLKCEKNIVSKYSNVRKTTQNRLVLISNSAIFGRKMFSKNQIASGLLND